MLRIRVALLMALTMFGAAACSPKARRSRADPGRHGPWATPTAKVTVVEYASVGLPGLRQVADARSIRPFKAKYIDTGKVHYVFREMLVGGGAEVAVAASGFLVARCAGKDKYFAVNDAIFKDQAAGLRGAARDPAQHRQVGGHDRGQLQQVHQRREGDQGAERPRRAPQPRRPRQLHADLRDQRQDAWSPGYHTLEEIDAAIKAARRLVSPHRPSQRRSRDGRLGADSAVRMPRPRVSSAVCISVA